MGHFRDAVRKEIDTAFRGMIPPVRGIIPMGKIDPINRLALILRVQNPVLGAHKGQEEDESGYLEYRNIPLPGGVGGVVDAVLTSAFDIDRSCTVGFRGNNLNQPYIIQMEELFYSVIDALRKSLESRVSAEIAAVKTAGQKALAVKQDTGPAQVKDVGDALELVAREVPTILKENASRLKAQPLTLNPGWIVGGGIGRFLGKKATGGILHLLGAKEADLSIATPPLVTPGVDIHSVISQQNRNTTNKK